MNEEGMKTAIAEAERFLKAARAVRFSQSGYYPLDTTKSAAARRASMDLTRALAQLRKRS